MKPSKSVFEEAVKFEALKLEAYLCPANVWTIGIGTTVYPNGKRVQKGDKCTREQAIQYFLHDMGLVATQVDSVTIDNINQNQFDALCLFVYNVGFPAYKNSNLRKRVNANPKDVAIRLEFDKWTKANGEHNKKDDDGDGLIDEVGEKQILGGLIKRRTAEANLYFRV